MYRTMHCAAIFILIAEILPARLFLIFCHVEQMVYELVYAFVLRRRYRHDGDAELIFQAVDEYCTAITSHLIHHVERDDHRHVQLYELHCEQQVALYVRRVYDIYETLRLFVQYEFARDDFFVCVWRYGVYARQICHKRISMATYHTVLAIDRDAWEVADVLVRAGQLVEKRGLAAVLVASERERERDAIRQRGLMELVMVFAFFA